MCAQVDQAMRAFMVVPWRLAAPMVFIFGCFISAVFLKEAWVSEFRISDQVQDLFFQAFVESSSTVLKAWAKATWKAMVSMRIYIPISRIS